MGYIGWMHWAKAWNHEYMTVLLRIEEGKVNSAMAMETARICSETWIMISIYN